MQKKIKIAIAAYLPENLERDNLGGASFVALAIAQAAARDKRFDLHIVTHSFTKNTTEKKNNITFHSILLPKKYVMPRQMKLIPSLIKKFNELKPDIIHVHSPNYSLAALKTPYPVVVTVHGLRLLYHNVPLIFKSNRLIPWFINILWLNIIYTFIISPLTAGLKSRIVSIYQTNVILLMLRKARHLIAVSKYVEQKIKHLTTGKIFVIDNALQEIYYNASTTSNNEQLLFVAPDITERRKDLLLTLKAFKIVRKHIPDAVLHIVGAMKNKNYFNKINRYLKSNRIAEGVTFLGQLAPDRLAKEYADASLFLSSSRFETFSLVIAQALASGRPVVATKSGGSQCVVCHGKTGFLVEYNDIKEFAEKVILLLKNKEMQRKMAKSAQKFALERFAKERVIEKTKEAYCYILEEESISI